MARIRQAESGGDDKAKSGSSTAAGRFQFTDPTWVGTYRVANKGTQETDAQILAKRGDDVIENQLMRRLTDENGKALKAAGQDITLETLSLAHFAGAPDAIRILRAGPDTPIDQILRDEVMKANKKLLEGKTAGDVIRWAADRIKPPPPPKPVPLPKPPRSRLDRIPVPHA